MCKHLPGLMFLAKLMAESSLLSNYLNKEACKLAINVCSLQVFPVFNYNKDRLKMTKTCKHPCKLT